MAALNSTVASVPTWEYVLVLTDANARTGKRGEGGEEAQIKVLGAYDRDVLNESGKILLDFAEDNTLAFLNTIYSPSRVVCSTRFKVPTAARNKHFWTMS